MSTAYFTRKEAAARLRISVATLDRAIAAGNLRVARIGARVVVSDVAIDEFVTASLV